MLVWKGKRALFEETALPHVDAVYRFCLHLSGNEPDAEDLTQECFYLAFRRFDQFRRGTNCRAWLFKIARNHHIDRLRRKIREPKSEDSSETPLSERATADTDDPAESVPELDFEEWKRLAIDDETVFYDLFGDEVNRFLQELQPEFRLAIVLCDVEGFSYREIGEVLGCPVGTVRSRIARARNHLKEKLYTYAKGLGYVKR
jgi:RNA polymerase sigma-70 factor (ECF subfamily)